MPEPTETLADLFPTLAPVLERIDQQPRPTSDTLRADPEHGGVTDDAITQYFSQRLGGRAPLPPPNSMAQVPTDIRFRSGTSAPAPRGGLEDVTGTPNAPLAETAPSDPSVSETPPPDEPPEVQPPLTPPAEDPVPETPPDTTEVDVQVDSPLIDIGDGRSIPRSRLDAYEEFNERLEQDPQLRQLIVDYFTQAQAPAPSPAAPAPAASAPVSELPQELADDPAFSALYQLIQAQQSQISQLRDATSYATSQVLADQQRENEGIVARAVDSFKTQHSLSDAEMMNVRQVASRLNVIESFLRPIDPITGAPRQPDRLGAVERALDVAFSMIPEYREREYARQIEQRRTDLQRKQKAGALSGSSGSVPRSRPTPTTEHERRDAMTREVAEMMTGSWSGGND